MLYFICFIVWYSVIFFIIFCNDFTVNFFTENKEIIIIIIIFLLFKVKVKSLKNILLISEYLGASLHEHFTQKGESEIFQSKSQLESTY